MCGPAAGSVAVFVRSRIIPEDQFMGIKQAFKRLVLPSGMRPRTIRGGAAKGLKCYLDLQISTQIWLGLYEQCLQKWLTQCVKPGAYCLDIGASDGTVSLMMARMAGPNGRVYAFEPGERFPLIDRTVALNRGAPLARVQTFNAFVGAASGPGEIPTLAIDSMVADGRIAKVDVVKIDVDGPEVEVLNGMKKTLADFHPHLFVEVHSRQLHQEVEAIAKSLGYEMSLEMPAKRELRPSDFNAFYFSRPPG
jgi:hypothetical protein